MKEKLLTLFLAHLLKQNEGQPLTIELTDRLVTAALQHTEHSLDVIDCFDRGELTDTQIEAMVSDPITPGPVEYAKLVKEVTEINTKLGFDWNGESI